MARPALDPADRRRHEFHVRFNDRELERVRRRAGDSKVAEWLRELAVRGRLDRRERERRAVEPLPSSEEMARQIEVERGEGAADAGARPSGRVASPGASGEPGLGGALTSPAPEDGAAAIVARRDRIEQEVAEAKMPDEEAHEAFVERRTRELHGQGKTTPVARRLAEAEWRNRGR